MELEQNNSLAAIAGIVFYVVLIFYTIGSWMVLFGLMKYGKSKFFANTAAITYISLSLLIALYGIIQLKHLG